MHGDNWLELNGYVTLWNRHVLAGPHGARIVCPVRVHHPTRDQSTCVCDLKFLAHLLHAIAGDREPRNRRVVTQDHSTSEVLRPGYIPGLLNLKVMGISYPWGFSE